MLDTNAGSTGLHPVGTELHDELASYKTSENPHESHHCHHDPVRDGSCWGPPSVRCQGADHEMQVHRKITLLVLVLVELLGLCLPSLSV